ncbi:hypothetical protein [Nocardiopsis ganjiahuensis]|nr:hypothetical protein [Nocardiopsis ganjiahuensis]
MLEDQEAEQQEPGRDRPGPQRPPVVGEGDLLGVLGEVDDVRPERSVRGVLASCEGGDLGAVGGGEPHHRPPVVDPDDLRLGHHPVPDERCLPGQPLGGVEDHHPDQQPEDQDTAADEGRVAVDGGRPG